MKTLRRYAGRALAAAASLVLAGGFVAGAAAPAGADPGEWTADAAGWEWSYDDTDLQDVWYRSVHGQHAVLGDDWPFAALHGGLGGGRGALGYPTGDVTEEVFGDGETGYYQTFERGVIYESADGAFAVLDSSPTTKVHRASGGGSGELGYPMGDPVQQAPGWWWQEFTHGYAYSSPRGAQAVVGETADEHVAQGGGSGLGYPVDQRREDGPRYWYQRFERGIVYCNPIGFNFYSTCHTVKGGFVGAHGSQGGGRGYLGYPTTNESFSPATGWNQLFERGSSIHIYTDGQVSYTDGRYVFRPGPH